MAKNTIAIIDSLGKYGGFHYYIDGMARGLKNDGWDVLAFVPISTGVTGNEPYKAFATFGKLFGSDPVWLRGLRYIRDIIVTTVLAKRRGARVVSYHAFHYDARELIAVWAAQILGMKVILTLHDVESFGRSGPRLLRQMVLAGVNGFILHNRFSLAAFEKSAEAGNKPRAVIPHGHFADQFPPPSRPEARAALGFPQDSMIFLFFGNSRTEKGLDLLLEACAGMKDLSGWILAVAGKMKPGQLSQFHSRVQEYGLDEFVRVDAKHISDEDAFSYYGSADLVVIPYRHVWESGVAIMAMSLRRATLVSNLEPLVESVAGGDAGLIFQSGDAKALQMCLRQAATDRSSLDLIGARAHARILAVRDWTKIGQETGQLINEVLGKRAIGIKNGPIATSAEKISLN